MITYNIRNLMVMMYLILPAFFYGVPYLYSLSDGYLTMDFFGTYQISDLELLNIFLGHLLLGFMVLFLLYFRSFEVSMFKDKVWQDDLFLIALYIITFFINVGIIKMFFYPLFLLVYIRRSRYLLTNILLIMFSFFLLVSDGVRYPLIQVLILSMLPFLSRKSVLSLFSYSLLSLCFLVFILQPLRSGLTPFTNENDFLYLYLHLQPIYIGAYLSQSSDWGILQLLSETLPFFKSVFGLNSVIDTVSLKGLSQIAYISGTRYGSNSSMYFSFPGMVIVLVFIVLFLLLISFFKSRLLYSSVLIYFVIFGPYFVRRTIGSYFIDLFLILFMYLIFKFLLENFTKKKIKS